jgi:hypothetical protein
MPSLPAIPINSLLEQGETVTCFPALHTVDWKLARPPERFELNTDSPLVNGLVLWMPRNNGPSWTDRAFGRTFTPNSDVTWTNQAEYGNVWYHGGGNDRLEYGSALMTGPPLTLFARGLVLDDATYRLLVAIGSTSENDIILMRRNDASRLQGGDWNDGSQSTAWTTVNVPVGEWFSGTYVSRDTDDRSVYLNGRNRADSSGSIVPDGGVDRTMIGAHLYGGSYGSHWYGYLSDVCIWNRALSDDEILYNHDNPFELYRPLPPRKFLMEIPTAVYKLPRRPLQLEPNQIPIHQLQL